VGADDASFVIPSRYLLREIDQKFVSQHKRIRGCGNLAAPAGIDLPASITIEIFGDGIASASPGAS
jgi:hypothetical protein